VTDCFTCVEPENYAAVALKMQETALDAEQCIFALEQRLRGAVNQPTLVVPFTSVGIPDNFQWELANAFVTPTFQNSSSSTFNTILPRGIYQAGLSFTITASGAVNDNTYRFAIIFTRKAYAALTVPNKFNVFETSFESNNGAGMDMTLHTVIESDGNDQVHFATQHGNTSSTCNITAGIAWVSRLSDLDAPRVVA
jgi:hypothetical protein